MSKGLLDKILDSIFDEEWVGRRGEKLTERELKLVQLFGRKGRVLRNVYLPKENGGTSEVDVIFISQKGIFIFESKNYSGWIFGDEKSRNWTVMLPNKQKSQFYNPIMQNRTHLKWMKEYVSEEIPLFSIIVFSERCELKKVTVFSDDIRVIKRDRTYATVRDIWDRNPDALSDEVVENLYGKLKELTQVDQAVKTAHVESIKEKFQRPEIPARSEADSEQRFVVPSQESKENVNNLICPKCGSKLVLRTAKKGAHTGIQFYGCSAFPKCRYTQNV